MKMSTKARWPSDHADHDSPSHEEICLWLYRNAASLEPVLRFKEPAILAARSERHSIAHLHPLFVFAQAWFDRDGLRMTSPAFGEDRYHGSYYREHMAPLEDLITQRYPSEGAHFERRAKAREKLQDDIRAALDWNAIEGVLEKAIAPTNFTIEAELERAVTSGGWVNAFLDVLITAKWKGNVVGRMAVEVKGKVPPLGDLLAQLNYYRSQFGSRDAPLTWAVCAPDAKYADILAEHGIEFMKYEPRAAGG